MQKLLFMTDIHLRADGKDIIGIDTVARFKEALAHAADNHADAEHLIIMGDLTHSGHVAEFEVLHDILKGVKPKVHLMLGNHDRRDHFLEVFPNKARTEEGYIQSVLDLGDTAIVMLDSLDAPPYSNHHHSGKLCQARLDWLDTTLSALKGKTILLCIHHPPFDVGFPGMDLIKLTNGADLFSRLEKHEHPIHIFAGHVHRTISGHINGYGFTMYKSTAHQMPMVLDSDDPSISVREPGAYGIVLINGKNIIAHSEDFTLPPTPPVTGKAALPD